MLTSLVGKPTYIPRVLDIKKGRLCYVVGTVYMDLHTKPSILEDIVKDVRAVPIPIPHPYH